jgi:hypothetical protein
MCEYHTNEIEIRFQLNYIEIEIRFHYGGSMQFRFALVLLLLFGVPLIAQQNPYFVTYDDHMEEVGNLEISTQSTIGLQKQDLPNYLGQLMEFEYGATGWWTTSLYLEGASQQSTTVFTGFRLENRFKPLKHEHWINPVLYFEFENINEATKIKKDVVGHAELSDESLAALRGEKARELEAKLILSSNLKNWNISENFIVEKNLSKNEGYEFGYALGVYRPLSTLASGTDCHLCRENFVAGMELYGGLGSTERFGLKDTAQYIAPGLVWNFAKNNSVKVSTGFGLTPNSNRMLLRIGYVYEINGFGPKIAHFFGGK